MKMSIMKHKTAKIHQDPESQRQKYSHRPARKRNKRLKLEESRNSQLVVENRVSMHPGSSTVSVSDVPLHRRAPLLSQTIKKPSVSLSDPRHEATSSLWCGHSREHTGHLAAVNTSRHKVVSCPVSLLKSLLALLRRLLWVQAPDMIFVFTQTVKYPEDSSAKCSFCSSAPFH